MKLMSFSSFLNEAIELSLYRDIHNQISKDYKQRYNDWFHGEMRIYIPMSSVIKDPIYQEINNVLSKNDYEIANWKDGIAKSKKSNRSQRIGRLLSSMKEEQLLKKFNERHKGREVSQENEEDLMVVISRHPYDLAGRSYDRSWTSCTHLETGSNRHYIPMEIDAGALIAYVIKPDDKNIKNPISRLMIIPLYNENDPDDTVLYVGDKFYGKSIPSFKTVVENWVEEHQGKVDISEYCLNTDKVYNDAYDELNTVGIKKLQYVLEENGWEIEELTRDYCEAVTYNLSLLDDIFMSSKQQKQTPSRVSNLFTDWYLNQDVNPESYKYNDNLQELLKNDINDVPKEKIIKMYREAGGDSEDWDDIVEELDDYLTDLTDDLTIWYAEKENEKYIEAARELFTRTLNNNSNIFSIKYENRKYKILLTANIEEFEDVVYMIEDSMSINDIYNFNIEEIEQEIYDYLEPVDDYELDKHLTTILF